ncbi:MAG: hypothetical protein AAF721_22550 [Myxococcota bacterium]
MRLAAVGVGLLAAALATSSARASPSPDEAGERVLVVGPGAGGQALVARLTAELSTVGFEVEVGQAESDGCDPDRLDARAVEREALAALCLDPREQSAMIELWVVDRVTDKAVRRTLTVDMTSEGAAETVAIRAVELLRASLLEIESPKQPDPAEPPVESPPAPPIAEAGPAVRSIIRPPRERFSVALGGGVSASVGGLRAAAHVHGAFRWAPHRLAGLEVLFDGPAQGSTVTSNVGVARVYVGSGRVGARLTPVRAGAAVRPDLAAGLGAGFAVMQGLSATEGNAAQTVSVAAAVLYARAGVAVSLTSRLRLRLDAEGQLFQPRIAVVFNDFPVAHWGRPAGQLRAALQIVIP